MASRKQAGQSGSLVGTLWRLVLGLIGAFIFLSIVIQVLSSLSLGLSGTGLSTPEQLASMDEYQRIKPQAARIHRVTEWPEGMPKVFHQAPELDAAVKAGKLPPVDQRLPENPQVIVPPDQIGPYGGIWTRFGTGPKDVGILRHRITYEGLVRWDPMGRTILPNLASKWLVEDEGRSYTFFLRRGVRWSDGTPFTANDILFWYNHVLLNKDLTPRVSPKLRQGKKVVKVDKLDEFTIRFRFAEPNGLFLKYMASGLGYDILNFPAHYFKQFHPAFNTEDELNARLKDTRFDFWYQLFKARASWRNPEIPRVWAWVITKPPPAMPAVCRRNPYYWKVDPEGNQLPYIDKLHFELYDVETINLKVINGEAGMQNRHLHFENYQLFMANRHKGGYKVMHWVDGGVGTLALCPNQNHKDPVLREIIQDKRFRWALSLAINRNEINQAFYFGVGTPRQVAPPETSEFYVPSFEKAFTKYDPKEANRLLDEMGLSRRNLEGIRLMPNGEMLDLTIEASTNVGGGHMLQMVAAYWREVGIKATFKLEARQLYDVRRKALLHDVAVWKGQGEIIPVLDPRFFFPFSNSSLQAVSWAKWYRSGGKKGAEPPEDVKKCINLYRQITRTADEQEQVRLFKEIIALNEKNLWVIGTVGDVPQIFVVQKAFRNVPEVAVSSWVLRTPGNTAPECYSIVKEN